MGEGGEGEKREVAERKVGKEREEEGGEGDEVEGEWKCREGEE